ncbi:MAG TPA: hypothetical protein VFP57_05050 [Sphingomicrobium sp.]|jgi:hypothetical protein|nr:hypothetical protein [Sphingomicrobium sp.]
MPTRAAIGLLVIVLCASCGASQNKFDWAKYPMPDWRKYQASSVNPAAQDQNSSQLQQHSDLGRVTFGDLKSESDKSLAQRLLGEVGRRIAYIDRHRDRWRYYRSDGEAAESLDLYTHPDALGSQYGLCGTEKYFITFDDSGHISTVSVTQRYGVEGPIFQWPISDQDWDNYYKIMCASAAASHAPSYFPAPDSIAADNIASLLIPAIDLAASSKPLPYLMNCHMYDGSACRDDVRQYVGELHLDNIDELTLANCPLPGGPKAICFTIETGHGKLGPFPKMITVKGSTYMNKVRVDSVDVEEGFTVS